MGAAAFAAFLTGAIVWPISQGYPTLMHLLADRIIADDAPRYDRAPLVADLEAAGFALGTPAHVRIFKREKRLEVWMARDDGRYAQFRSYDICTYSGTLGPKLVEGDLQAPEGFYRVSRLQLNPNSRHHLAFNLGFPNAYDRSYGRTGSALMVHGGCSSVGCFAITDAAVDEVYAIVEAALARGQEAVDVHVFPFALTDRALAAEADGPWTGFWHNLKHGYDLFEAARVPPRVAACRGAYTFGTDAEGQDCDPIAAWS
ncbi:MAG TPA: murein L,D-transpeptidase family protein [Devosia sp.]|nr:murein L,D-transpeptidase family protein [Devosia sp.]